MRYQTRHCHETRRTIITREAGLSSDIVAATIHLFTVFGVDV